MLLLITFTLLTVQMCSIVFVVTGAQNIVRSVLSGKTTESDQHPNPPTNPNPNPYLVEVQYGSLAC